jgi:DnaJ domain.
VDDYEKLLLLALLSFTQISKPISLETQRALSGVGIAGGLIGTVYFLKQYFTIALKHIDIVEKLKIDAMSDANRATEIKYLETLKTKLFAPKQSMIIKSLIANLTARQELLKAKKLTIQERTDLLKERDKLLFQYRKHFGAYAASVWFAAVSFLILKNINLKIYWEEWARNEEARRENQQGNPVPPQLTTPWHTTLGVDINAPQDQVRTAYRALILQHHPDHSNAPDAKAQAQAILDAWKYYHIVVAGNPNQFNQNTTPAAAPVPAQNQAASGPAATNAQVN